MFARRSSAVLALPRLRRRLLDRLERPPYRLDLARQKIQAVGVLGQLAAGDLLEVDLGRWNRASPEQLERLEAAAHRRSAVRLDE